MWDRGWCGFWSRRLSAIRQFGGGAEGWVRAGIEEGTCRLRVRVPNAGVRMKRAEEASMCGGDLAVGSRRDGRYLAAQSKHVEVSASLRWPRRVPSILPTIRWSETSACIFSREL